MSAPDSSPRRRQFGDSILVHFVDGLPVTSPATHGDPVHTSIGIDEAVPFLPLLAVEVQFPEGDYLIAPAWVNTTEVLASVSPEGMCASANHDYANARRESVPLGAAGQIDEDAGGGCFWAVPPKLYGFLLYMPQGVTIAFERYRPGTAERMQALSLCWRLDGKLEVAFTRRPPVPQAETPAPLPTS